MRFASVAAALLLTLLAGACAITPTPDVNAFALHSSNNSFEVFDRSVEGDDALVLPVVHDRQTSGPSCGAHALASVINYWRRGGAVTGDTLFRQTPPQHPSGYSLSELLTLARANDLVASAVRLPPPGLVQELESGRPVLVPVRLPALYVQPLTLPGANLPVLGLPANFLTARAGRISEWTGISMVDHYLLVAGYDEDRFVVVEPINGFRTISLDRLERYRRRFDDAAIVFSAAPQAHTADAAPEAAPMAAAGAGALQLHLANGY